MAATSTTYGVLGVGALASAIVTGLCDGVEDPPDVLLSPRNSATASGLAARFPTVTVAADNQGVVDGSAGRWWSACGGCTPTCSATWSGEPTTP